MPYVALLVAALWSLAPLAPISAGVSGGPWTAPLAGPLRVVRPFDPPSVRWGAGHRGVDLASWAGAPVYAAGAGTVTFAGGLAGRGVVAVTHGTLRTTYEPVTAAAAEGSYVGVGDVVAWLDPGHAGTAPPDATLHWGLLRGEDYLDPLSLLRRGPSRLVPVPPAGPPSVPWLPPSPGPAPRDPTTAALAPQNVTAPGPHRDRAIPAAAAALGGSLGAAGVLAARRRRASRGPP